MKPLSLLALAAVSLLLSACATPVSRDLSFTEASASALLVVAAPMQSMATITEFRRVNLETQTFEDEIVDVVTAGLGVSHVINYSTNTGVWLSMRELPPGDYALVSLAVNTFNGYASGQRWACIYGGVPVYRLERGRITIVSTWEWWSAMGPTGAEPYADAVMAEFERARTRYPAVIGAATMPAPQAEAHWAQTRPNFMQSMNRNCAEPDSFTVLPWTPSLVPAGAVKP